MRHALIITHAGSGGTLLCRILSTNPKVRCFGRTNLCYNHPSVLSRARIRIDKVLGTESSDDTDWYVDKLINNYDFTSKPLYKVCKFIYMVRTPQVPLATMVSRGVPLRGAENLYLFRLRRMCEMAVHTDGVLLTYEDLVTKRAFPLLRNALELKSPLQENFSPFDFDDGNLGAGKILKNPNEPDVELPDQVVHRCLTGYRRYLKFLENRTGLIRYAI
jgi:hypothetical protein